MQATTLSAHGVPLVLDDDHFGELDDSTGLLADPAALRARFLDDGYVFLRGFLDAEKVLAARRELLTKYAIVGEARGLGCLLGLELVKDKRTREPNEKAGSFL